MFKISFKSFFLGLGIGLLITSSLNIIIDSIMHSNVNNEQNSNTYINNRDIEKDSFNERDYLILLIDSNTNIDDVHKELISNGLNIDAESFKNSINNKGLKEGIYKIDLNSTIEDIIELIIE